MEEHRTFGTQHLIVTLVMKELKMTQTVDAVFIPLEAQRYNVIISIGSNWNHDIQFEMASDGTAKLYRRNGANLIIRNN